MTTIPILIALELVFAVLILQRGSRNGIRVLPIWVLLLLLTIWGGISGLLGYSNVYISEQIKSLYPGYWLPAIPVMIVITAIASWQELRRALLAIYVSTPPLWFVLIHTIRLAAIGGLYKAVTGQFNERFAFSVGIPDLLFGFSALWVGYLVMHDRINGKALAGWHLLGASAILLPMYGLMHWFTGEPEFYRLFEFPMSMAPTFIVPVLVLFNLWCVWGILQEANGDLAHEPAR